MTTAELYDLWLPAMAVTLEVSQSELFHCEEFEKFLGVDYYTVWGSTPSQLDQPLDPDFANFLRMLVGSPHSKTLLRAYRIRKGLIK